MTTRFTPFLGFRRRFCGALLLALAVGLSAGGCARPTSGHVIGTVLQSNGKPLPGGSVVFYPTEGRARHATAKINDDGTYEMPEAPAGKVKIAVNNLFLKEGTPPPVGAKGGGGLPPAPKGKNLPPFMMGKGPPKAAEAGPPKGSADKERAPEVKGTPPAPDKYVPINPKMSNPETSELTLEVKAGKQKHDIQLK